MSSSPSPSKSGQHPRASSDETIHPTPSGGQGEPGNSSSSSSISISDATQEATAMITESDAASTPTPTATTLLNDGGAHAESKSGSGLPQPPSTAQAKAAAAAPAGAKAGGARASEGTSTGASMAAKAPNAPDVSGSSEGAPLSTTSPSLSTTDSAPPVAPSSSSASASAQPRPQPQQHQQPSQALSGFTHPANQASLGRGRAPTASSTTTATGVSGGGSPASRASANLPPMTARQPPPPGQGHRSMPSTSASITFSDAPTSGSYHRGGNYTETESVLSADETDTGNPYSNVHSTVATPAATVDAAWPAQQQAAYAQQPQPYAQQTAPRQRDVRRSRIPLNAPQAQGLARIGRTATASTGGLKPTYASAAAGGLGAGSKGKARLRSTSRARHSGSDSDSDPEDPTTRHRSVADDSAAGLKSAAFAIGAGANATAGSKDPDLEDDEVKPRDRGEELVRRRMKERKKEKKEAEKRERKRREEEIRRDRERQASRGQKVGPATQPPLTARESMVSDLPMATGAEDRPSLSRRSTDPNVLSGSLAASSSGFSRPGAPSREASAATAIPVGPYSPGSTHSTQAYWPPPTTSSALLSATPTPASPFFPPGSHAPPAQANRTVSYVPSNASFNPNQQRPGTGNAEADVFSEAEAEESEDRVPELQSRDGSAAWRDEVARSMQEDGEQDADGREHGSDAGGEDGLVNDEPEEEEEDDDDDDDDEESGDGVEYTLKDRQDAINIEHPFGLPIWKPALYKKVRSVTRNADHELHEDPSSDIERHLLVGNVVWLVLFGWWLALLSAILAALLCIVPFGGAKYGRVIWELGGYLFWPFGKYVEKYEPDDSSSEELRGYDELSTCDGEETVYEDPATMRDIEDAGRTWGRRSGYSSASAGTVKKAASRPDLIDALEGREPTSAPAAISRESGTSTPTPNKYKRSVSYATGTAFHPASASTERAPLLGRSHSTGALYGAADETKPTSSGSETEVAEGSPLLSKKGVQQSEGGHGQRSFRVRALGRLAYWTIFYLAIAPVLLLVCILCWGLVFTIPMAKLLWILLCNLGDEPLALHFRSPSPHYSGNNAETADGSNGSGMPYLEAGQRAPRHSRKTYDKSRAMGRLLGPNSKIILCTKKALGLKYYKYTVDGTNIIFINLLPMIAFVIFDFFVIAPKVEQHQIGGFLAFISAQATMFILALLSVIPLSYFIGMAVASISAQSSIGMGAVINATFGSIIEIILYSIALTQAKAKLVEGSIVGSLLAGVLLMPGLSMIGGAVRRKEQKFNARSAGVTSTMLIMAIIGILTPTLFYEIYGTFQLTCSACPEDNTPDNFTCRRCFYEHVDPVDDVFYRDYVQNLGYYCAVILVLSYLIGLWFSLRTHASQIWQNQHAPPPLPSVPHTAALAYTAAGANGMPPMRMELPHRSSMYKRLPQAVTNLLPSHRASYLGSTHGGDVSFGSNPPKSAGLREGFGSLSNTPLGTPDVRRAAQGTTTSSTGGVDGLPQQVQSQSQLSAPKASTFPPGISEEEYRRAIQVVAATAQHSHHMSTPSGGQLRRQPSHVGQHERETSKGQLDAGGDDGGGHGGHDAPNWSRTKSYSVLFGCTALYAIISEILVDVVDVVLEGSGIPEKFLGVTLFALVPNTTEFMNAISFAMNGNIALSMEIGSAYAIQVCMIQIPAMIAFTFFYGIGKESMLHRAFSLVFPRWDAIAIMFSVFLLTYTYIEARSNYYKGSILVLSYMVLLGGFYMAPGNLDNADDPLFNATNISLIPLSLYEHASAIFNTLFSR